MVKVATQLQTCQISVSLEKWYMISRSHGNVSIYLFWDITKQSAD